MHTRGLLLRGESPTAEDLGWLPSEAARAISLELHELKLARFCRDEPTLTDAVILGILEMTDDWRQETARLRHAKLDELLAAIAANKSAPTSDALRDAEARAEQAARTEMASRISRTLHDAWSRRVADWNRIVDVFGTLGALLGSGHDLSRSILRMHGWSDVEALARLLAAEPRLRDLVHSLGRLQGGDGAPAVELVMEPLRRISEEQQEVRSPLA